LELLPPANSRVASKAGHQRRQANAGLPAAQKQPNIRNAIRC
jgi:hypothetical protein